MTPTDTLLAILDPDPVLRGRQFERFVVTLLRTHPLWSPDPSRTATCSGCSGAKAATASTVPMAPMIPGLRGWKR